MPPSIEKPVQDYTFFKKLTDLPFIEAIYLFGSRARGDHDERSDIDLAIDCPLARHRDWEQVKDIAEHADTMLKIGAVRFDEVTNAVKRGYILHGRQLLYLKTTVSDSIVTESREQFARLQRKKTLEMLDAIDVTLANTASSPAQMSEALHQFDIASNHVRALARKCLIYHGIRTNIPLTIFKEAWLAGWLTSDRLLWEQIVQDRVAARITRDADAAPALVETFYQRLPRYTPALREAALNLTKIIETYLHGTQN